MVMTFGLQQNEPTGGSAYLDLLRPQPTGRVLVSFQEEVPPRDRFAIMADAAGLSPQEFLSLPATPGGPSIAQDENARLLADVGLAVVSEAVRESRVSLMDTLASRDEVKSVRPEFFLFASEAVQDTAQRTWGVGATRAFESRWTGAGIKVAVLDTGIAAGHPDFDLRRLVTKSFVDGETADDIRGHGTHCAGTIAASPSFANGLRYSVAPKVTLYVGKVMNNRGAGREADIIAGVSWAIQSGCEVISMSLGRAVRPGDQITPEYEPLGKLALDRGSLIIAAAGNDSTRQYGFIAPVREPASVPSIMAVAALDVDLSTAYFSNGARHRNDAEVDIAGPGVAIVSSFPAPQNYERRSGTSMACPHVAGIAALWAQSDPSLRGLELWKKLTESALPLNLDRRDVGAGLVQAPVELGVHVS